MKGGFKLTKEAFVFKRDQRYYTINDQVVMMGGYIDQNPFYRQTLPTNTLQWVMENPMLVKGKIARELKQPKTPKLGYGKTVQDVYDFITYYYATHPDKEFQPYYKGKIDETGNPYVIEAYVLSNVRNLIYKMTSEDDMSAKKFGSIAAILPDGDQEADYTGTIRESYALGNRDEDYGRVGTDYYLECFDYLNALTHELLNSRKSLDPEMIFQFYFGDLMGYSIEDLSQHYEKQKKTLQKLQTALTSAKSDPEVIQGIQEMLHELAYPVFEGHFTLEDLEGYQYDA